MLHYLNGVSHTDERLDALIEPVRFSAEALPSQRAAAGRVAALWSRSSARGEALPVVQLCGDAPSTRAVASSACDALGLNLYVLPAEMLPADATELDALLRLWGREAALGGSALLVECDRWDAADTARPQSLARFVERCAATPLVVSARERRRLGSRASVTVELERPGSGERQTVWRDVVGPRAQSLNGRIEALASQFHLSADAIRSAGAEALAYAPAGDLGGALWDACRAQARPRLDSLAQRLDPALGWDDLVLPEQQRATLREIAAHVRHREVVYETWGFGARGARGLGVSALFAGVSGTGKTMAAEVLARELRLDLYRIDLSQVVSKYIGETEKNLRRVFDAAEEGGAILLFDEADALFGRRSEVKDSHDRYANIEVSYLLQRVEAYRGLAILTTNMKSAVDSAFLRRIRFHVEFPFPDTAQRAEIWRRIFPASAPTDGLDVDKLASLHVTGGNIHNIALGAAFLAAEAGGPVRMSHVLSAARSEYAKLERSLTEAEVADWV